MPFLTTPERIGIRKGMLQMIEDALRLKFGEEGAGLMAVIRDLDDPDKLRAIHQRLLIATSLKEVREACVEATAPVPTTRKKPARRKRQQS